MRTIAVVLLTVLGCAESMRDDQTATQVYLLAGQSNMDGRGNVADLTAEQGKPLAGARIFYRNPPSTSDGWKPLGPGYSVAPGYKGALPSLTFGPEITFGRTTLAAAPARELALIKGAVGGTNLRADWSPGLHGQPETQGLRYRDFLETVAQGLEALRQEGTPFVVRGIVWHQGEADSASTTEVYQQQLTEFIARIRQDVGQPALPFVIGEVYDNGNRDTVRAAQRAVAASVPRVAFASSEGLATFDMGTHFDAASQLLLGERLAAAMAKLLGTP